MTRVVPGTIAAPANSPSDSERMNGLIESMLRPNLGPMSGLKRIEHVVKTRFEWAYERFADPGYAHQAGLMPGVENLLEALRRTDGTRTVIHGDLQQKNVLIGNDGEWQVIDPLTCRGDVNADAALWAVVQEDGSTLEQRIEELSESPCLDRARLEAWCYVLGVAEYRTYQPETAARIDRFVDVRNWRDLAGPLGS
jgi:streptomycin 6-kinase